MLATGREKQCQQRKQVERRFRLCLAKARDHTLPFIIIDGSQFTTGQCPTGQCPTGQCPTGLGQQVIQLLSHRVRGRFYPGRIYPGRTWPPCFANRNIMFVRLMFVRHEMPSNFRLSDQVPTYIPVEERMAHHALGQRKRRTDKPDKPVPPNRCRLLASRHMNPYSVALLFSDIETHNPNAQSAPRPKRSLAEI